MKMGVFYIPASELSDDTGSGPAKGSMMNFPMPKQATDEDFARFWSEAETFIKSIETEFIILQCGADSMKGDPITHLQYSQQSCQLATESLCKIADELYDGRLIALGGGYNMDNISLAWPVVVRAMLD